MNSSRCLLALLCCLGLLSLQAQDSGQAGEQQAAQINALRQALFNAQGLGKILGKPLAEGSSAHFRFLSMFPEADNKAILDHTEKAVAELGKLLGDADIFTTVPDKLAFLILDSKEAYEKYVQALVDAQISDDVQAGLFRHAAGFSLPTPDGSLKISRLEPRAPRQLNSGFVAHSVVGHYLEAWKNPGKGAKPLPVWFSVGMVLLVDMRVTGSGAYYEIAYGKAETKDDYRDTAHKEDWLRTFKASKNATPFDKVASTPFSTFTHECRAISWMACEALLELNKKKTLLAELTEKFRVAGDYESCLEEVSGWNHKKLASRVTDWVNSQKVSKEKNAGKGKK